MTFTINGTDMVPYIAYGGLKWSRNDIDNPETGRSSSGLMYRGRVATKIRLDVTCRLLKGDELRTILNLILPEYVTVTYDDPMYGVVTKTMYSNNNPAVYQVHKNDGTEWWLGVTFPLIER
jgi:hypothetical protein